MNWEKGNFEVMTREGPMQIEGLVNPPFAVRRENPSRNWSISHLPTGLKLPFLFLDVAGATEIADRLRPISNSWDDPTISLDEEMWKNQIKRIMEIMENASTPWWWCDGESAGPQTAMNGY